MYRSKTGWVTEYLGRPDYVCSIVVSEGRSDMIESSEDEEVVRSDVPIEKTG